MIGFWEKLEAAGAKGGGGERNEEGTKREGKTVTWGRDVKTSCHALIPLIRSGGDITYWVGCWGVSVCTADSRVPDNLISPIQQAF